MGVDTETTVPMSPALTTMPIISMLEGAASIISFMPPGKLG
jgi:hypothetical protein